jgi:predicted transcriptional regulator
MNHAEHLDTIKAAIAEHGSMTLAEIAQATGLPEKDVRHVLQRAVTKTGGLVTDGRKGRSKTYNLLGMFAKTKSESLVKTYVHSWKPLTKADYDPFAHRNLAMLTREKEKS